jgi:hypothetical protein
LQVAYYQQLENFSLCPAPKFDLKKLLLFEDMYPFKRAKSNNYGGNPSGRRYIDFYAWDIQKSKLGRKHYSEVNNFDAEQDRRIYGKRIIQRLNNLLKEGCHFDTNQVPSKVKREESRTYNKKPVSKNVTRSRYPNLTKKPEPSNDYTLYSWKHSGVVAAYKAGIDIKTMQNRATIKVLNKRIFI